MKSKKQQKDEDYEDEESSTGSTIITTVLIVLLILSATIIVWQVIRSTPSNETNECLEEIAIRECENRNMSYTKLNSLQIFSCQEDPREVNHKKYYFLEEEIEKCKNED